MPLATVRMVPSFGLITALYAVSVARPNALASVVTLMVSTVWISLEKPRNSWERMTPEFPLAPRREPEDIAFASFSIVGSSIAATSLAAERIVIVIFVPVSPSGTGNTLSSLMNSLFISRFFAPERNAFFSVCASTEFITTSLVLLNLSLSRLRRRC